MACEKIRESILRWSGHVDRKTEEDIVMRTWNMFIHLYINLRRSRDCLSVRRFVCPVWVCVIALLHLLILGKCYAVHINASSL